MKKRERDGEEDGGQPHGGKRAARVGESSAEANGNGNGHVHVHGNGNGVGVGGQQQKLTTDDALQYLKDVKEKFKDDKEKYNEFLEVMKDFKAQRVDTAGVIKRVKELFRGHRHLILGFNAFLPPGFEITLPVDERRQQPPPATAVQVQPPLSQQQQQQPQQQQPAVEFDQAINYVNKIKARFQADEHVYKAFLEILNMYRGGNKNINEVYQEVALLFANHSDLLQEFTYFLPGTSNGATSHRQEQNQQHPHPHPPPAHHHHHASVSNKPVVQPQQRPREIAFGKPQSNGGLGIAKKERVGTGPGRDREAERRAEKARKGVEKKDLGDRKEGGPDRDEGGRDKEKDSFEQKPKRTSARNASDAIRRQSLAGEGGEGFSGPGVQVSADDAKAVKGVALQYPIFDKVKSRLRNRDTYQEFLKCLNIFSQEIITRVELQSLVGDILGKHADLLEGFNEFLTHCENVEGYLAGVFSERKLGDFSDGAPLKVVKMERDGDRDRNREKDRERERERDRERKKEREKERIRERVREREREKVREKERERERGVKERERDHGVKDAAHKAASQKDKFVNKPISELDLSNCERCTPSYRLLPKQYPKPVSSHRTALGISVLNDNWVSVTSGSEDYSLKNSRKNQHEESLFRCEDDRYELDMLLKTTSATANLVGQYTLKQDGENGKAEALPPLDEFLSPIHLRCIERIYGDHGLDILDVMKKNTFRAMPVIHYRLVQKEEEWVRSREEMNKVWAEVYTKNVAKALDHRSCNFKQQDKKSLGTKSLLLEIKEVNDKNRREDDAMLAIAAGNRRPLLPDFRHEFPNASIHDDLYDLIKYSSEEISNSPEHTEKTLFSWRTVLARIIELPPRRRSDEDMEEASDGKGMDGNATESGGGSEGDETSSPGGDGGLRGEDDAVNVENAVLERSRSRTLGGTDGDVQRLGGGCERSIGECLITENADAGVGDHGSEDARDVSRMGLGSGNAKGSAARTEGSGWLHAENSGRKQSCLAGERSESEARLNDGFVPDVNGSGVHDMVDREEGELSPSSEQEDRNKVKYSPRGMGIEENGVKILDHEEVDPEGAGVTEMDLDQDANDKREVSPQKSSEDSDNPSEVADETSASEQSSDEHSEHEEEEDEQEEKVESEGEADGMADADDVDEDGNSSLATAASTFAHCKPLAIYPPSAMAVVDASQSKAEAGRVFYGNDTTFVLCRLYQVLYERILSAKVNAELAGKKRCSDGGGAPNLYSRFMQVLYGLLDGSLDNSTFEDECRDIIGTQSYVLFTLDKLIFKLVKQLQAAAADEGLQKLLALNAYEYEREAVDLVYYADACVVLHDDNLYRFEHRSSSGELLVQLMENHEKLDFPGNAVGSPFQKYLDEFTKLAPARKNQIIRRVLIQKYGGEDQDDVIERALLNTKIVNGLENKISCRTYKVSYVLDTEDLFLRVTARRFRKYRQQRALKKKQLFDDWLDKARRKLCDSASESSISR